MANQWRLGALVLVVCVTLLLVATLARQVPLQAAAPGASVSVPVQVPAALATAPFNVARSLNVPPDFSVAVVARVPNARFLLALPNGDVLVSQPNQGQVTLLRPASPAYSSFTFASGMSRPHDMVLHSYGGQQYVFVAAENAVYRFAYTPGATSGATRATVVQNLPTGGHMLKNIAIDSQNQLYVSIASATNASPSDLAATPKRGAIYVYDATASNQQPTDGRLFAQGIRNAEGLAFVPGTRDLWVVVNNRDEIICPYSGAIPGSSVLCSKGNLVKEYVDNHPPEEFTRVRDGGNYGWPFCNPNPDTASGMNTMPFDFDWQNNLDETVLDCSSADRISKGIQAHSAPLGLSFLGTSNAPLPYRGGAVVGLHGSWNRTERTGYKFVFFPWDALAGAPGEQVDFVTGWLDAGGSPWGRPVDSAIAADSSIYLSDDQSGTVYRLVYSGENPVDTPTPELSPRSFLNWVEQAAP